MGTEFLTGNEVATLRAIQERLRTTRPEPRTSARHAHDAVYDGLSAVIATGQGTLSTALTFAEAGKSVKRAVALA